jgi:hypothetical protein
MATTGMRWGRKMGSREHKELIFWSKSVFPYFPLIPYTLHYTKTTNCYKTCIITSIKQVMNWTAEFRLCAQVNKHNLSYMKTTCYYVHTIM